jgi:thioredoxin-related protein
MKTFKVMTIASFVLMVQFCHAQESFHVYSTDVDASQQIKQATKTAKSQQKHVLLMIGGNWCKWCKMFNEFSTSTPQIDSLMKSGFVVEHINFSKENKNLAVMEQLDFPQRFGFPVFVILNADGMRIHTQQTGYLEEGEGYSEEKVSEFLKQWSPNALKRENYLR